MISNNLGDVGLSCLSGDVSRTRIDSANQLRHASGVGLDRPIGGVMIDVSIRRLPNATGMTTVTFDGSTVEYLPVGKHTGN